MYGRFIASRILKRFVSTASFKISGEFALMKHSQIFRPIFTRRAFRFFCNASILFSQKVNSTQSQPLGGMDRKLYIEYTCKVCKQRTSNTFSKQAYEKGVVLVRCPGCQNLHLIADNLSWFQEGTATNVEELMKSKGEIVRKNLGTIEFTED